MILSVRFYGRKNMTFYEENVKFPKNNTFNNEFCNRLFPYYRFLPIVLI